MASSVRSLEPARDNSIPKSLYKDVDLRFNIYELDDFEPKHKIIKKQASSVCCLVPSSKLRYAHGQYTFSEGRVSTLAESVRNTYGAPIAEREFYQEEPCLGYGSGFLVGKALIATAAHCVCKKDSNELDKDRIDNTYVVFGFMKESENANKRSFTADEVYRIKKVAHHHFSRTADLWADWAVLELDRRVWGREPLNVEYDMELENNQKGLYILGHPDGIYMKHASDGKVKNKASLHFECNLPISAGNSGSCILNEKGNVVGIACTGHKDRDRIDNYEGRGPRVVSHHVSREEKNDYYERCQRMHIKTYINQCRRIEDLVTYRDLPPVPFYSWFNPVGGLLSLTYNYTIYKGLDKEKEKELELAIHKKYPIDTGTIINAKYIAKDEREDFLRFLGLKWP